MGSEKVSVNYSSYSRHWWTLKCQKDAGYKTRSFSCLQEMLAFQNNFKLTYLTKTEAKNGN
ncbi:hypothetical protein RSJ42_07345 [Methanosarcina hadiensis]|uniref:hypothetical protein n=1 Tax=Methanosarcina hadiensis TaxID=3078083 RepID=UPI0039775C62